MIEAAAIAAFGCIGVAIVLSFWRMVRGPDATDRVLALDTLYINAVALIVVYGVWIGSARLFDAALLIALLGFVGTVALAKYLLRGSLVEAGPGR